MPLNLASTLLVFSINSLSNERDAIGVYGEHLQQRLALIASLLLRALMAQHGLVCIDRSIGQGAIIEQSTDHAFAQTQAHTHADAGVHQ